jgi:hypothetical protein
MRPEAAKASPCPAVASAETPANTNAITPVTWKSDVHTITAGLNYRFNWSGGPKP